MTANVSDDLKASALAYHRLPKPGKLAIQATKPLATQHDLALAYTPGVAVACLAIAADPAEAASLTARGESRRGGDQRHRSARARQHRPARRQAGDGRQGGAVQEVRRHRRVRHRDRRQGGRPHRRRGGGAGADLRRHQSRGHQGAGVLRGREPPAGTHEDSGVPRRSARHRDHRRRRGEERALVDRQAHRGRQDRDLGRRRRRARLPQSARLARRPAGEHLGHRRRGRRLRGPPGADGPLEERLCPEDRQAQARRHHRRRRHLSRPVCPRGAQAGDGESDGGEAADHGARQSDAGDHAGRGVESAPRRADLHRAFGLSEPGQQRPVLSLHLPRRARCRRDRDQRGDEDRRGRGDRGAGARSALGSRGPRLWRRGADLRARLAHPQPLRSRA